MKTTLIIENGKTKIVLRPENDFEIDILEKVFDNSAKYDIKNDVLADVDNGFRRDYKEHRIELIITEKPKK